MKTLKQMFVLSLLFVAGARAAGTEKKSSQVPDSEPEVVLAPAPAPSVEESSFFVQGDLGLGNARYPRKSYLRLPVRASALRSLGDHFALLGGLLYRLGAAPQNTRDIGFELGLRALLKDSFPLYTTARIGYMFQNVEWPASVWIEKYSSTAQSPYASLGLGYQMNISRTATFMPEITWEYVPRAAYRKALAGNTLYAPAHINVDVTVGAKIAL